MLEEMVGARDFVVVDCDVLLGPQLLNQLAYRARCHHRIGRTLDHDARSGARGKEAEIVHIGGRRDRDEAADFGAAHQQLHPDQGAKAETGDPSCLRLGMDRLDPVERSRSIRKLTDPIVETALAATNSAEIEAQRRKTAGDEGAVHRHGDPVVHRPAALGVRVEDHRDRCTGARTRLETAFKAAFGTGKNDCGHRIEDLVLAGLRRGFQGIGKSGPVGAVIGMQGLYRNASPESNISEQ